MLYSYITTATTTQVYNPGTGNANQLIRKVRIQVNTALTGTITVIDDITGSTGNVAVITNPTVGSFYEYWGLTKGVRIITSASCDITVSVDLSPAGR